MERDNVPQYIAALETRLARLEAQLAALSASGVSGDAALQDSSVRAGGKRAYKQLPVRLFALLLFNNMAAGY